MCVCVFVCVCTNIYHCVHVFVHTFTHIYATINEKRGYDFERGVYGRIWRGSENDVIML